MTSPLSCGSLLVKNATHDAVDPDWPPLPAAAPAGAADAATAKLAMTGMSTRWPSWFLLR